MNIPKQSRKTTNDLIKYNTKITITKYLGLSVDKDNLGNSDTTKVYICSNVLDTS